MPWALIGGEEKSGVTTMRLVEQMDAGPILLQDEVALAPDETSASLEAKLIPVGSRLLLETIRRMKEGNLTDTPQREEEVTYAPMLKKENGRIDWNQPADAVDRKIRAFHPWPSAYTFWRGQLMKIFMAAVMESGEEFPPGEVIRADRGGLWVATGRGLLDLKEIQLENRKRLPASEFLKGARIEKGERL